MTNPIDIFARLGGELTDPPITLPASQPLELSGEAVRARLCVFMNESGQEYALRPDLTLPVAIAQAADGLSGETVKRYSARNSRRSASSAMVRPQVQRLMPRPLRSSARQPRAAVSASPKHGWAISPYSRPLSMPWASRPALLRP